MNNENLLHTLVGEWSGAGRGEFPTVEPFQYLETLRFSADDRPFVHYEQKTRRRSTSQADYGSSHWESGFIRPLPAGKVELFNAQSGGRLEWLTGSLEQTETGLILRLQSTAFLNDPRMLQTSRIIIMEGDTLRYSVSMHTTAVSQPALHLEAKLKRT